MLNINNSENIIWEGQYIKCLDICKGDLISKSLFNLCVLYTEQQDIINSLGLLNYSCFGECSIDTNNITITKMFQYLLNNDKEIKKLIKEQSDLLDNSESYIKALDLKCLLTDYLNSNPTANKCNLDLDISKVISLLIDNYCQHIDLDLASLNTKINKLKEDVQSIIDTYELYEEPIINSSLSNSYILSEHILNVSDNIVSNLKSIIGESYTYNCNINSTITSIDNPFVDDPDPLLHLCNFDDLNINGVVYSINKSITNIPNIYYLANILNDILIANSISGFFYVSNNKLVYKGFIPSILQIYATYCGTNPSESRILTFVTTPIASNNSTSLSAITYKQNSILCEIQSRLKQVEDNCCKSNCSDIKIGFSEFYDVDQDQYVLTFNNRTGNFIPADFIDNGSTLTITDKDGKYLEFDIFIENSFEYVLDLSGLNTSGSFIIGINGIFVNDNINCSVCFSKSIEGTYNSCSVCRICARGVDDDKVTIHYTSGSNNSTLTSILTNGQCLTFKLPEDNPNIISVTRSSQNINLFADESECSIAIINSINKIQEDSCWFFPLPYPAFTGSKQGVADDFNIAGPFYKYNKLSAYNKTIDLSGELYQTWNNIPGSGIPDLPLSEYFNVQAANVPASISLKPIIFPEIHTLIKDKKVCVNNLLGNVIPPPNSHAAELLSNENKINGVLITLVGQPIDIIPELEIIQFGTNFGSDDNIKIDTPTPLYLKGQLIENCNCPPIV